MRHRWSGRKLGRTTSHRKALLRNLVTELLDKERIITTVPKAKELRSVADRMITLGKRETLHARRQALAYIRKKNVVHKLFDSLAPRFHNRNGGYTRILRLGYRKGDDAELALIELVGSEYSPVEVKPEKKPKKEAPREEPKKAAAKEASEKKASKTSQKKADKAPKKTGKESKTASSRKKKSSESE